MDSAILYNKIKIKISIFRIKYKFADISPSSDCLVIRIYDCYFDICFHLDVVFFPADFTGLIELGKIVSAEKSTESTNLQLINCKIYRR